jgi:NAD(P)-dependent dehydrogenase (short-subunit alcohol dehydrogenase family)
MVQRVLVTAGASGIGKEIARAYAAIGATVCVCDIDAKALDTAAKEIPGLKTIVCDVSKRDEIERMVAAAVEALGGLDVLVNNAGIAGPTAPVEKADPDQWEAVMAVDVSEVPLVGWQDCQFTACGYFAHETEVTAMTTPSNDPNCIASSLWVVASVAPVGLPTKRDIDQSSSAPTGTAAAKIEDIAEPRVPWNLSRC